MINQLFKSQFILLLVICAGFCSFQDIHAQCGNVQINFPASSPADTLYICKNGGAINLMQYASTTTGSFSDNIGAVQSDGTFDPTNIPPGTSQVIYTDGSDFCPKYITVVDFVIPEDKTIFCKNDRDIILNNYASPSNGIFSTNAVGGIVSDVTGTKFSPKSAGPGTHTINYTIGGTTCSQDVYVKNVHFKLANIHIIHCTSADSILNLLIADVEDDDNIDPDWNQGAYFGGPGITNGHYFDSDLSGVGTHSIYYTDGVDTCWDQIKVFDAFQAEITPLANTKFCADSGPVIIQGNDDDTDPAVSCGYYLNNTVDSPALTDKNELEFIPSNMDLGVYDIIYACVEIATGCPSFDTLTVEVSNTIADIDINKNVFCESEGSYPIIFSPDGGALTFSEPGLVINGSTLDIGASEPGIYTIFYALQNLNSGCEGIDSIQVEILEGIDINFDIQTTNCSNLPDKVIYTGEPLPSNAELNWSIDNYELVAGDEENSFDVVWDYPGSYRVILKVDSISCTTNGDVIGISIEDRYKEDCQTKYFIPNIFTPNGDNKNDVFKIEGDGVQEMEMRIFDRWGNQVFYSTDVLDGWDGYYDGVEVNSGVFFYTAELVFEDGTSKIEKGNVTLLR